MKDCLDNKHVHKAKWVTLAEVESALKQSKANTFIPTSFRYYQENNYMI